MKGHNIPDYLKCIPLSSDQLYDRILDHKLTSKQLVESGFPMADPDKPEKVALCSHSVFSNSQDPARQICRCGKTVSLLKKDWYIDNAGCYYHLGKRIFCDGPENGLFSCCKRVSQKNGCAQHTYHVSSFRPVEEVGFIQTKLRDGKTLNSSNVFAVDCEMVFTTAGMEVVKVSIVRITGEVVYHSFVQPTSLILDFNTVFSGVREEDLIGITTTLTDVQSFLLKLLNRDSILIGHGLENDLLGLRLLHKNIVDTSIVFAHERGFPLRHSLKYLAAKYLDKTIHTDSTGHSSIEDAKICLELILNKIYLESFTGECIKYDFDLFLPCMYPVTYTTLAFGCASNPLYWQNIWNCPYPRGTTNPNGLHVTVPKFSFETPVFPIASPPQSFIIYPVTSITKIKGALETPRCQNLKSSFQV